MQFNNLWAASKHFLRIPFSRRPPTLTSFPVKRTSPYAQGNNPALSPYIPDIFGSADRIMTKYSRTASTFVKKCPCQLRLDIFDRNQMQVLFRKKVVHPDGFKDVLFILVPARTIDTIAARRRNYHKSILRKYEGLARAVYTLSLSSTNHNYTVYTIYRLHSFNLRGS